MQIYTFAYSCVYENNEIYSLVNFCLHFASPHIIYCPLNIRLSGYLMSKVKHLQYNGGFALGKNVGRAKNLSQTYHNRISAIYYEIMCVQLVIGYVYYKSISILIKFPILKLYVSES